VNTDPFIFVNANSGEVVVNGILIVNNIMYNQGKLTVNDQMYIARIFINFNEWINNALVISVGEHVNSSGSFTNNATYLDNGGFFDQGEFSQEGDWFGSGDFMNDPFENKGVLSPGNGENFIAQYTVFSDYVENGTYKAEIAGTAGAGVFINGHDLLLGHAGIELNGTLEVILMNGFVPEVGNSFDILSASGGITGNYSNVIFPTAPTGTAWLLDNDRTRINVSLAVALAVDLGKFEASVQNERVWLEWESYSEVNHDYYQIEKSKDTRNWEAIGQVKGAGYSNEKLRYNFFDENPMIGDNYYRIVLIDFTGEKEYSAIQQIIFSKIKEISITPNLFQSANRIDFNIAGIEEGTYAISLINMNGKEILKSSKNLNSFDLIDLKETLSLGVYILRIENSLVNYTHRFLVF